MDRRIIQPIAIICAILLIPGSLLWSEDTPAAPVEATQASAQGPTLTPDQINSLVAPIALYPDELVSQILVASTYPLEIVQAYQWMQQHPELKGQDLTSAAQKQAWDPSIQALVAFPDVLKRMNQDITWTTNLGNAFLASQANVMDSIQKMRARAEDSGKLTSTQQQKVTNTTDNGQKVVVIEPANPDVVYVPDYDPVWIWGPSPWYPYPGWYYPPPPPIGFWCWWGPSIVVGSIFIGWGGWGGWGWHPGWGGRTVIVNRTFITTNHFNTIHVNSFHGHDVWVHDSGHRMGVAYPNRALSTQFRPVGRPAFNRVTVSQAREQFRAAGTRVQADRFGSRQISPSVYNHNRTAFGGMEGGANARTHSSRGYSSMNRASGAAPRGASGHAPSSGGHVGGGGGGGHGGGNWGGGGGDGGHGGGNWGGGGRR
jgi:hypothetical protein